MGEQVAAGFLVWGCSSVGRAPALQAGGQGFESLHLHWIRTERDFREPYLTCTLKIAYRKRYNIFNTKDTRHPRKIKVCNTNNLKPTFVTLYRRTLVRGVKRLFVGTAFLLMSFASQMTSRCFQSPYECEHSPAFGIINCRFQSELVKLIRAQGGCLGTKSR